MEWKMKQFYHTTSLPKRITATLKTVYNICYKQLFYHITQYNPLFEPSKLLKGKIEAEI